MDPEGVDMDEVTAVLRTAGARFAFVFGSHARAEACTSTSTWTTMLSALERPIIAI